MCIQSSALSKILRKDEKTENITRKIQDEMRERERERERRNENMEKFTRYEMRGSESERWRKRMTKRGREKKREGAISIPLFLMFGLL